MKSAYTLYYTVVLQVIDPKRAAAQNWSQLLFIHLVVFSGQIRSPYKILSKSVEKQKSYVVVLSAQLAPKANYERDNVQNPHFFNICRLNDILIAVVMPSGIF